MPEPNWTDLSRRVAEALGMEPNGYARHSFRDPDGNGFADCVCGAGFGDVPRHERCPRGEIYYPDLTTYEGFGLLLAAMRAKGWWWEGRSSLGAYLATFYDGQQPHRREFGTHTELPVAALLAAAAALGIES